MDQEGIYGTAVGASAAIYIAWGGFLSLVVTAWRLVERDGGYVLFPYWPQRVPLENPLKAIY